MEHCFKIAEDFEYLGDLNVLLLEFLCSELGIRTEIISSRDLKARGTPTERLVNICREVGANRYVSGPAAKSYINEAEFAKAGIGLEWMDYSNYPCYSQLHGTFDHHVTVLDLLLNTGPDACRFFGRGFTSTTVRRSPSSLSEKRLLRPVVPVPLIADVS